MFMDDYYTDEELDFSQSGSLNDDFGMPEGTDSIHNWDYFEPEDDEPARPSVFESQRTAYYSDSIPEQLRTLLEMIRRQPWQITAGKAFYEQAIFMQDYVDDAEIVGYMNYFPTYRDMTIQQLRSYFTIRHQFRLGKFPDVSLSYIFVYVYETLMKIGVNTAEDGYEILSELNEAYRDSAPKLSRHLTPWLRDYVVYNQLSGHYAEVFASEHKQDEVVRLLAEYAEADCQQLFATVCSLSKYDLRKGALFTKEKARSVDCVVAVLRRLIPVLEKERHHRIETLFVGKRVKRSVPMFTNAVFYDPAPVRNAEVEVSLQHSYLCRSGLWTRDEYVGADKTFGKLLGIILRETDCQLREAFNVKPRLKPEAAAAPYRSLIHGAMVEWQAEEQRRHAAEDAEKRRVSIDYTKLGRIRDDAEVVKDKLLDGIMAEKTVPQQVEATRPQPAERPVEDTPVAAQPTATVSEIDRELHFLRLIFSGGDWKQYLRVIHVPEGVMVENINNELIDVVGDIVLEDDGNGLHLIEDYRVDIEKLLSEHG